MSAPVSVTAETRRLISAGMPELQARAEAGRLVAEHARTFRGPTSAPAPKVEAPPAPPAAPNGATLLRDIATGKPLGFLDGDHVRDENGKPIADRAGDDAEAITLADKASRWMTGQLVTMDLGMPDVAQQATQADFGIPSGDCCADVVSPITFVKSDRGVVYQESVQDATDHVFASGNAGGTPQEINPNYSGSKFTTSGYALSAKIPRHVWNNADFDLKARTIRFLVEQLRLGREKRVAKLLTTAASWATDNQIAVAGAWNSSAASNTLTDLFAALGQSFLNANAIVIPENAERYFYQATTAGSVSVRDYVQSGGEMPRVVIARRKLLSTGKPAYVWAATGNVAVVRLPDDIETDTASSRTFRWLGEAPDGDRKGGMLVRVFFNSQEDVYWVSVSHSDAEVMPTNTVGACLTGAIA